MHTGVQAPGCARKNLTVIYRQAVFLCHHVTIELLCKFPHVGYVSVCLRFPDAYCPCDRERTLVAFEEFFEDLSVFRLDPPKLLYQHRQDIRCGSRHKGRETRTPTG